MWVSVIFWGFFLKIVVGRLFRNLQGLFIKCCLVSRNFDVCCKNLFRDLCKQTYAAVDSLL